MRSKEEIEVSVSYCLNEISANDTNVLQRMERSGSE